MLALMKRPTAAVLLALALSLACARGEFPPLAAAGARVAPPRAAATTVPVLVPGVTADTAGERAGRDALTSAAPSGVPLLEALYLPSAPSSARAWRLTLSSGQLLDIQLEPIGDAVAPAILDVLEHVPPDDYRLVAGGRAGLSNLIFEAPRSGSYVLRVRSGVGRGGRYRLAVLASQGIVFPVAGCDASAIRGSYGDARAGGSRDHDGVDIFAPAGTPVVAAANAVVSRVETSGTGGRVIWAVDSVRNLSYFYAHLQRQLVRRGARIAAGDTVGTVGNSGNARGSSPHLHFGVYLPGTVPIDPAPLLAAPAAGEPTLPSDSAEAGLGGWARTRVAAVRLRSAPDRAAAVVSELGEGTIVQLVGVVKEWRRIRLADGSAGFVANWLLAPLAGTR